MKSPDCNTKLIGTGPFEYVSWKFGDKFVAKRNPNYWYQDPKTGAQLPYLDQITFVPQEDGAKRTVVARGRRLPDDPHVGPAADRRRSARTSRRASSKDTESDKFTELGYVDAQRHRRRRSTTCRPARRSRTRSTATRTTSSATTASCTNATGSVRARASTATSPTPACPTFDPAKAKAAAAQYKQETGKDLTFTLVPHRRPVDHAGRGARAADGAAERRHQGAAERRCPTRAR